MFGDVFHHTFWHVGDLRCVLISRERATRYLVQVLHADRSLRSEQCRNADDGARIAERLWVQYVDSAT